MLGLGGLFGVIYGAAIAGSEWTWGTFKTSVARGESRSRYLLSTFAAIAVVLAIGLLITFLIGVVAAAISATIAGIGLDGIGDADTLKGLPEQFARGWVAITATAALGFAVATLARSQLAGIGVGIAFYFGETFAGIFLPDVVKYMPFHLANAAVASGERRARRRQPGVRRPARGHGPRARDRVAGRRRSWSRPCSASGPRSPADRLGALALRGLRRQRRDVVEGGRDPARCRPPCRSSPAAGSPSRSSAAPRVRTARRPRPAAARRRPGPA